MPAAVPPSVVTASLFCFAVLSNCGTPLCKQRGVLLLLGVRTILLIPPTLRSSPCLRHQPTTPSPSHRRRLALLHLHSSRLICMRWGVETHHPWEARRPGREEGLPNDPIGTTSYCEAVLSGKQLTAILEESELGRRMLESNSILSSSSLPTSVGMRTRLQRALGSTEAVEQTVVRSQHHPPSLWRGFSRPTLIS